MDIKHFIEVVQAQVSIKSEKNDRLITVCAKRKANEQLWEGTR